MIELPTFIYEIKEEPDSVIFGNLILIDDDDNVVTLPMSHSGLLAMTSKLVSLANDIGPIGDLAEKAGAGIALDCCDALLAAKDGTQGERIQIIQDAIVSLRETSNPKRAAGGFACVSENVVMRGLEATE